MRERKKALERLAEVKRQMERLEKARLAEIEKNRCAAREKSDAMIGFLARPETADSLLLGLAGRKIGVAGREAARLDAAAEGQKQRVIERAAQRHGAEQLLKQAAQNLAREEEKQRLLDLAERLADPRPASFP